MPPSGFSKKAVSGLLQFVLADYKKLMELIENERQKDSAAVIRSVIGGLKGKSSNSEGEKGLRLFMEANYEDLLAEVESGKHPDVASAIQYEIGNLESALSKLHIDENGDIAERKGKG